MGIVVVRVRSGRAPSRDRARRHGGGGEGRVVARASGKVQGRSLLLAALLVALVDLRPALIGALAGGPRLLRRLRRRGLGRHRHGNAGLLRRHAAGRGGRGRGLGRARRAATLGQRLARRPVRAGAPAGEIAAARLRRRPGRRAGGAAPEPPPAAASASGLVDDLAAQSPRSRRPASSLTRSGFTSATSMPLMVSPCFTRPRLAALRLLAGTRDCGRRRRSSRSACRGPSPSAAWPLRPPPPAPAGGSG